MGKHLFIAKEDVVTARHEAVANSRRVCFRMRLRNDDDGDASVTDEPAGETLVFDYES
ncbi:MAG: hypothetical protein LBG28_15920 [Tannerella sp.]|jgi:hypothetical protein|nr:hypothetical protein [Tannerella sp.]